MRDAELAIEPGHGLGSDPLQVQQVEHRRRELLEQLLVVADRAGVDELADLRGEVLADRPAAPAAPPRVSPATRRVSWTTVSAAFRYARILNGFSPLISRRSPISVEDACDGEIVHVITSLRHTLRCLQEIGQKAFQKHNKHLLTCP